MNLLRRIFRPRVCEISTSPLGPLHQALVHIADRELAQNARKISKHHELPHQKKRSHVTTK